MEGDQSLVNRQRIVAAFKQMLGECSSAEELNSKLQARLTKVHASKLQAEVAQQLSDCGEQTVKAARSLIALTALGLGDRAAKESK
ncbi:MAG: hypothetical protein WCG83_00525 [Candidatus Peregrinibacteria bacterium]